MKNQALISSKDKCKKLKCRLLQFLFGSLRVKLSIIYCLPYTYSFDVFQSILLIALQGKGPTKQNKFSFSASEKYLYKEQVV